MTAIAPSLVECPGAPSESEATGIASQMETTATSPSLYEEDKFARRQIDHCASDSMSNNPFFQPLEPPFATRAETLEVLIDRRAALIIAQEDLDNKDAASFQPEEQEFPPSDEEQESTDDSPFPPAYNFVGPQQPYTAPVGSAPVTTIRSGNVSNVTVLNSTVHIHYSRCEF